MHLMAWGFIPILDFIHLLAYLQGAAQTAEGKGSAAAWSLYEQWLRWAWSGQVKKLLAGLGSVSQRLGKPPDKCGEDDPRKVVQDALGYVRNNAKRMDYPRYRQLGLPISSAAVESTIKRLNRRVRASDKLPEPQLRGCTPGETAPKRRRPVARGVLAPRAGAFSTVAQPIRAGCPPPVGRSRFAALLPPPGR
jgi:hypothetical protein